MHIIYSWDNNCIRAIHDHGNVEFLPLTMGGRNLRYHELKLLAEKHWNLQRYRFTYLREGEGYAA